jgi:hypothetical protein
MVGIGTHLETLEREYGDESGQGGVADPADHAQDWELTAHRRDEKDELRGVEEPKDKAREETEMGGNDERAIRQGIVKADGIFTEGQVANLRVIHVCRSH